MTTQIYSAIALSFFLMRTAAVPSIIVSVIKGLILLTALRQLQPNVLLIDAISLLNDTASDMLYPLIPLYLSSVLMAGPKALGIIEGIAEATSSILKLGSGVLVDRTNRTKPWIV